MFLHAVSEPVIIDEAVGTLMPQRKMEAHYRKTQPALAPLLGAPQEKEYHSWVQHQPNCPWQSNSQIGHPSSR